MDDKHLCILAGLIVAAYGIYMYFNPHTDGVVFGSVLTAIGVISGVAFERWHSAPPAVFPPVEPQEDQQT